MQTAKINNDTSAAPSHQKLATLRTQMDAGEFWRVRESARGMRVTYGYSPDLFALEAEAALAMSDLPAAGALYYLHGADSDDARNAIKAFRHRCGGDHARMAVQAGLLRYWLTLPDERLRALRDEMGQAEWDRLRTQFERSSIRNSPYIKRKVSGGQSAPTGPIELKSVPGFAIVFLVFLLFAFIGFLTVFVFILEAVKTNYM